MRIRPEFKPQSLWVGLFWKVSGETRHYVAGTTEFRVRKQVDMWICIIPMLPIHFTWQIAA